MKIEKLNENQIRCTLTREDLQSRQIKLTELAYGSEKLRLLLRDMMKQASKECGFDATDAPLMIEAIPLSMDSVILTITKVDNPEELDSRFARFSAEENAPMDAESIPTLSGADDIIDLISKLGKMAKTASAMAASHMQDTPGADNETAAEDKTGIEVVSEETPDEAAGNSDEVYRLRRFYLLRDLETAIKVAGQIDPAYVSPNSLYKNPEDGNYFLILQKADASPALFNQVCNTVSEYGLQADYTPGLEEFFTEHMQVICADQAIQTLRSL
ncbi:MAG: adaptor protein MecA [Lachnospiraceae bacterium]|nr:adaptor protein MecA [Lachnospiraceae bacterium]